LPTLPYLYWRVGFRKLVTCVEFYAAACFLAFYLAVIVYCFPAYVERVAPIAAAVYVPVRASLIALAMTRGALCWLTLSVILIVLGRARLAEPLVAIPALSSVGAIIAFFVQGRGWPYHAYPAIALIAFACAPVVLRAAAARFSAQGLIIVASVAATLSLAFVFFSSATNESTPALEGLVASTATHPKILVIGPDIAVGHPLTRRVSGVWVGTPNCLWITAMAQFLIKTGAPDAETRRRYESYKQLDREMLISDIEKRSPDAILFDGDKWKEWAFAHPDVAAALADYTPVGAVGEIMVYGRKLGLRSSQ